ncbi:hypothetical protein B4110_0317 [Parageobacillus toebii]|uniref:Uncharacterized protein n=2 Tax=Anoxybacillaceae TaxID=3120669 RepID=A0A150MPX0_9BACL|nr:hypothetical protein B4110_0317 [Parageobacillus toebii]
MSILNRETHGEQIIVRWRFHSRKWQKKLAHVGILIQT